MRLDKFLSEMQMGTRSQLKQAIRKGAALVNGSIVKKAETAVDPMTDEIVFCGKKVIYEPFRYLLLNKPSGVVSATTDTKENTVLDLIDPALRKDLFPVGRLDKDTVGLLLLSNDGALAHELLSPRKHVEKRYFVRLDCPLSEAAGEQLERGVDIGEGKPTRPAKVLRTEKETEVYLSICEGKFHQVKRMFHAVGTEVIYLQRVAFGPLTLEDTLAEGDYRPLTKEEIETLKGYTGNVKAEKSGTV